MHYKKHLFILLSSFLITIKCANIQSNKPVYIFPSNQSLRKNMDKKPRITIWIHGTRLISRPFFKSFFSVPQGLHAAKTLDIDFHHRHLAQTLEHVNQQEFPFEHFYFFGWSGKLSHRARINAAQELFSALRTLIQNYVEKYDEKPFVRIITHSHGGNVALNLAHINKQKMQNIVNELILLACPVQDHTKAHTQDPLFGKIYSLFSTFDTLQVLDPQGIYLSTKKKDTPIFSERTFPWQKNMLQAEISFKKRGLFHVEFILCKFMYYLPEILQTLDKKNDHKHILKVIMEKL